MAVLVEAFLFWASLGLSCLPVGLQILTGFGFLGFSVSADFFEPAAVTGLAIFLAFSGDFSVAAVLDSVMPGTVAACTGAGLALALTFSVACAACTGFGAGLLLATDGWVSKGVLVGGGTSRWAKALPAIPKNKTMVRQLNILVIVPPINLNMALADMILKRFGGGAGI